MNLLTKEECEKALETLSSPPYESSCGGCICGVSDCGDCPNNKANKLLNKLIDEHFDNPPLKFEELKEGMWVWDNQLKWFFKVVICNVKVDGYESLKMFKVKNYEGGLMLMLYEPNRFYRKEVQE